MDRFRIHGGFPLKGSVVAAGSKNSTLPVLAASLLLQGESKFKRVPGLRDVDTMLGLLESLDSSVVRMGDEVQIRVADSGRTSAPYEIVRKMRASVCVLGPLLARRGRAEAALPGGCVLGVRPIDIHLRGLEALGARVSLESGVIKAEAPRGGLQGAEIEMSGPRGSTVLGTANVMMAAVLAAGTTVLRGCAREPEIENLVAFLNSCGALIEGQGTDIIRIEGVSELRANLWTIPPDRIEAGTLLLAGAATRGKVRVEKVLSSELAPLSNQLLKAGVPVQIGEDWVEVDAAETVPQATSLTTGPWPDFPTDLQAQWMAFATQCSGLTEVQESIYPERFLHVAELKRMGASAGCESGRAWVEGPCALQGAPVIASDLRASAALVIGGLVAEGETIVKRIYHLDRGYEGLENKLVDLGAQVLREVDSESP